MVAGVNSALICIIAVNTSQFGFIPANLFCLALYAYNVRGWRKALSVQKEHDELGAETQSLTVLSAHQIRI